MIDLKQLDNKNISLMIPINELNEVKNISNFINDSHLYAAQLTVLTPLPGTRLRERFEKEDRLLPTDWNKFTFLNANFIPKKMSPEQLEKGLMEAYGRFYNTEQNIKRMRYFKEVYKNLG